METRSATRRTRLGIQEPQQNSISALQAVVRTRLDLGFTRFKMDRQRSYLTSGTDNTLQADGDYPYQTTTVNQSGFDNFIRTSLLSEGFSRPDLPPSGRTRWVFARHCTCRDHRSHRPATFTLPRVSPISWRWNISTATWLGMRS